MNSPGRDTSRLGPRFPRSRVTRPCPNNSLGDGRDPQLSAPYRLSLFTHRHQSLLQKELIPTPTGILLRCFVTTSVDPTVSQVTHRCLNRGPFFLGFLAPVFGLDLLAEGTISYYGSLALS
jgi:hypothetical protein